jgi:hypothetical protein
MYVNAKMRPVESLLGIRGGGMKEKGRGGGFKCDIYDTL